MFYQSVADILRKHHLSSRNYVSLDDFYKKKGTSYQSNYVSTESLKAGGYKNVEITLVPQQSVATALR